MKLVRANGPNSARTGVPCGAGRPVSLRVILPLMLAPPGAGLTLATTVLAPAIVIRLAMPESVAGLSASPLQYDTMCGFVGLIGCSTRRIQSPSRRLRSANVPLAPVVADVWAK